MQYILAQRVKLTDDILGWYSVFCQFIGNIPLQLRAKLGGGEVYRCYRLPGLSSQHQGGVGGLAPLGVTRYAQGITGQLLILIQVLDQLRRLSITVRCTREDIPYICQPLSDRRGKVTPGSGSQIPRFFTGGGTTEDDACFLGSLIDEEVGR